MQVLASKGCMIECPHCNELTTMFFNEQTPGIQSGCLTTCDICDESFCLLPEWLCKGCSDWLECAKYSFVDSLAHLERKGFIEFDVTKGKRIVK